MASPQIIVLVTGGNKGVGLETVKQLAASREPTYTVLLGCRSLEKGRTAAERVPTATGNEIVPVCVDVESDDSIAALGNEMRTRWGRLDCLVNNAGAALDYSGPASGLSVRQTFAKQFDINVTGTHLLTAALVPLLLESATPRIVFLCSGGGSLTWTQLDNPMLAPPAAGWPKIHNKVKQFRAYKASKSALNMIMREWERELRNDGVKVIGVEPGFLATDLGEDKAYLESMGAKEPATAGKWVLNAIQGHQDAHLGRVVSEKAGVVPW